MDVYKSKYSLLSGSRYDELIKSARREYTRIAHNTRRQPYLKSQYFGKSKVFVAMYWQHLGQKSRVHRMKRLKVFSAAIDLIRHTTHAPITKIVNDDITYYRFLGQTSDGTFFYVQIKQDKKGRKDFMSAFPVKNKRPSAG